MRRYRGICLIALAAILVLTLGVESHPFSNLRDHSQNVHKESNFNDWETSFDTSDVYNEVYMDGDVIVDADPRYDLPKLDESQRRLKKKCMKNGKDTSYNELKGAMDNTVVCINDLVNKTALKEDIDDAKLTNDFTNVARKYCKNKPIWKGCIRNLTTALEPCLEESEKALNNNFQNVVDAFFEFVCYKEGAQLALFKAKRSQNCIRERSEAIGSCISNTTFHKYVTEKTKDIISLLYAFKLEDPECQDIFKIQECVVNKLNVCEDPTPASFIDSLFNFVTKATPCNNVKPKNLKSTS